MGLPTVRSLIEAGVHFGHRASRWHPKMAKYIFGKNKLIHIIDLKATLRGLVMARRLLTAVASSGETVLFVGTKRQARPIVRRAAESCDCPYVTNRWLGGILTNFRTIRSRLARLDELEAMETDGTYDELSKKMISVLNREKSKIKKNLEGIREMKKLPSVMVVVDPSKERNAVLEARKLNIPVVALLDTDCNPDLVDVVIPGNDDALRSIEVITGSLADAIREGRGIQMAGGKDLAQSMAPKDEAPEQQPAEPAEAVSSDEVG